MLLKGKRPKKRKGRYLNTYIPEEDLWLFGALEKLQRRYEEQGIPMSRGELIRTLLKNELVGIL